MEEQRLAEESEFQSFLLKLLNDHKTELVNFSANSLITSYSPLYSIAPYTYIRTPALTPTDNWVA